MCYYKIQFKFFQTLAPSQLEADWSHLLLRNIHIVFFIRFIIIIIIIIVVVVIIIVINIIIIINYYSFIDCL